MVRREAAVIIVPCHSVDIVATCVFLLLAAAAGRVFPFCFRRKPVIHAAYLGEPIYERLGIVPRAADYWLAVILIKSRIAPVLFSVPYPFAPVKNSAAPLLLRLGLIAGSNCKLAEFPNSDVIFCQSKIIHADFMHWLLTWKSISESVSHLITAALNIDKLHSERVVFIGSGISFPSGFHIRPKSLSSRRH